LTTLLINHLFFKLSKQKVRKNVIKPIFILWRYNRKRCSSFN